MGNLNAEEIGMRLAGGLVAEKVATPRTNFHYQWVEIPEEMLGIQFGETVRIMVQLAGFPIQQKAFCRIR
jgi:hypothetical protein